MTVVDDFAHHPTAIRETVLALKGRYGPGKLIAAFEPRSATSRRAVFQHDFADALSVADEVVLAPLYAPEKVPDGRAPGRRAPGRRPAARGRPGAAHRHRSTRRRRTWPSAPRPATPCSSCRRATTAACTRSCCARLGDPVMPARSSTSRRSPTCWTASASRTRCWISSGRSYLVIPGAGAPTRRWWAASRSRPSTTSRCCACWRSRPSGAARGWVTCWSRPRPSARGRSGVKHAVPGHRRRAGLLRREAGLRGRRSQGRRAGDHHHGRVHAGAIEGPRPG